MHSDGTRCIQHEYRELLIECPARCEARQSPSRTIGAYRHENPGSLQSGKADSILLKREGSVEVLHEAIPTTGQYRNVRNSE